MYFWFHPTLSHSRDNSSNPSFEYSGTRDSPLSVRLTITPASVSTVKVMHCPPFAPVRLPPGDRLANSVLEARPRRPPDVAGQPRHLGDDEGRRIVQVRLGLLEMQALAGFHTDDFSKARQRDALARPDVDRALNVGRQQRAERRAGVGDEQVVAHLRRIPQSKRRARRAGANHRRHQPLGRLVRTVGPEQAALGEAESRLHRPSLEHLYCACLQAA